MSTAELLRHYAVSYQNADAIRRVVVRCLLSALAFPLGAAVMWIRS